MSATTKILLCLITAVLTAMVFRMLLGKKRDLWFSRKIPKSMITLRTKLSMYVAIGTPRTIQGVVVAFLLLSLVALECLTICFFL